LGSNAFRIAPAEEPAAPLREELVASSGISGAANLAGQPRRRILAAGSMPDLGLGDTATSTGERPVLQPEQSGQGV